MAATKWLERVVQEWATALKDAGFEKEDAVAAQHYIDMEYSDEFEYPKHFLALRAFFLTCELVTGQQEDDHIMAADGTRAVVCAEAAYRMGYADAQKQAKEKADGEAGS